MLQRKTGLASAFVVAVMLMLGKGSAAEDQAEVVARMRARAREEAATLKSSELFARMQKSIARGRAVLELMQSTSAGAAGRKEAGELFGGALTEQLVFREVLEERASAKEPDAAFFVALDSFKSCEDFAGSRIQGFDVRGCYAKAIAQFKAASDLGVPGASFNVGLMYEQGLGSPPSRLAAADWYVRSGEQSLRGRDREQAFAAIEAALRCAPGHPEAVKLLATAKNLPGP